MSKKNSDKSNDSESMNLAELLNLITNYIRLQTTLAEKRLEDYNEFDSLCECDECGVPILPLKGDEASDGEDEVAEFPDGFDEEWS
jgi:hypothetical protein